MLTITIIFALLVALWGFSGTIATYAKRSLSQVEPRSRATAPARPAQRARGSRPISA